MKFPESFTGQESTKYHHLEAELHANGHLLSAHGTEDNPLPPACVNLENLLDEASPIQISIGNAINGHEGLHKSTLRDGTPLTNGSTTKNGASPLNGPVTAVKSLGQSPIAICGMSLRLPAGLKTPEQLWEFLLAGGDARGLVPSSRYNIKAFHDRDKKHGTVPTEYGYFLEEDIGTLDTSFFSMARMEVERTDPQQRLMLEVARECFEDAGETAWRGKRIGCYMGTLGEDWCEMYARETQNWGPYRYTGHGDFSLPNRVSYEMDLQGPSVSVRTACSSSLVALHEACSAISRGDCDSAIVGGANLIMTPGSTMSMMEQGVLSHDGSCKTFSAEANGYARGEAVTSIYIKRLDEALKDGNPIRALIRGTATNHDGKTPGFTVPSAAAQETLIRRAYEVAGITDFSSTKFVECHGTGTPVGDPIEADAVSRVFGKSGVYIGSIKPNFGHTEGASGLLSVIKTVLALQNSTVPPNIKFTTPNPAIPFHSAKLTVPIQPECWPEEVLVKRASVNSFGVGGSNAHAVLESVHGMDLLTTPKLETEGPQLMLFSANSQTALARMVENYRKYIGLKPENIENLAYTLANKREHLPYRTFSIANAGSMGNLSTMSKSAKYPMLVMVFTGQGAQWPSMGRALMDSCPTFLESIQTLDSHLQAMKDDVPEWRIEEELRKVGKESRVHAALYSQPLCTAVQIALVDTLAALGIRPDAVVGHSSGEIAAAYASHAITAKQAILNAVVRGVVTQLQKRPGAMAAVGMGRNEVEKYLIMNVSIACDNSSESVTISGDIDKVEAVLMAIRKSQPEVVARKLQVEKAYHSYHMTEIGGQYHSLLENHITARHPSVPFFSSVIGGPLDNSTILGSKYWQQNLESPVLFRSAVTSILHSPSITDPVFLEIGPHSALAGPIRQILTYGSSKASYAPTLVRNQNCYISFLSAVGKLYSLQFPIDMKAIMPTGTCLSDLPPYPYDKESYWYESRLSKDFRQQVFPHHDLLGSRLVESTDLEPSWRNLFHLNTTPWIRDHKVGDNIVFPFAGYVAIAGEAVRQVTGHDHTLKMRHIILSTALVIPEGRPVEMITTFRPYRLTDTTNSKWWEFTIASHNGSSWIKHCTGEAMAQSESLGSSKVPQVLPRKIEMRGWFDILRQGGLDLGPSFCNLGDISASTVNQQAVARLLNHRHGEAQKYHVHPTVVDSVLQLFGVASTNGEARKFKNRLPTSCDYLEISQCASEFWTNVTTKLMADSVICEAQGSAEGITVLRISGLKLTAVENASSNALEFEARDKHAAARLEWGPDVEFIDINTLLKPPEEGSVYTAPLEELKVLCLVQSQRVLTNLSAGKQHLIKYKDWINNQLTQGNISAFTGIEDETISKQIDSLVLELTDTPARSAAVALQSVCSNISAIFLGQFSSWEDVLDDQTTRKLHEFIEDCDYSSFIQQLAHSKPNLRVLELGSWRDSPNPSVLADLTRPNGSTLCSKYTFTSKSFISAQENQTKFSNMEYRTLDIREDPLDQGFVEHQYDLVITSQALHGTRSIRQSLVNIKKLLCPTGYLLLQDLCPKSKWLNFIFGTHPRWWCGLNDNRIEEPYVGVKRWQEDLVGAGYVEKGLLDPAESVERPQSNVVIVAKPLIDHNLTKRVTLLCGNKTTGPCPVTKQLEGQGYKVFICTIDDTPMSGQDIIALLDNDGPFFEDISDTTFNSFKRFLHNSNDSGIFWVTKVSQMYCTDPRFAQAIGLARTMRSELLLDFATCEVDNIYSSAFQVVQAFTKFQERDNSDKFLGPEYEYCIYDGIINVGRFYPFEMSDELLISKPSDRAILEITTPGRPSTLHWVRKPAFMELQPKEVEIEVHAAGLNFRDVLVSMNIVQLPEGNVFGLEGAGFVRRIGSQVKSLAVGDRVAALELHMFATTIKTQEEQCVKIPEDLSFQEASTMFFPYMTAMHSLIEVGGLKKGRSVLIHSACGGVGIAAIQLAQMLEAEIFVTVGTEEKVDYLIKTFDISRNRIFNSRDDSFVEGIMNETKKSGVDLVLNSLSGELLHATWKCLAPFGKLVEIGKRDLIGFGKLDMNNFLANRSYCCVDADAFRQTPALVHKYYMQIIDHLQNGQISPIRPVKTFDAIAPYDAFRYMQPGQHIGRIGLSIREAGREVEFDAAILDRPKSLALSNSVCYLLVGGLGGLGRAISTWMVQNGARNLIYLSRNAGSGPNDAQFVHELESMNCQVQLIRGSVTNKEDVTRAFKEATYPVKGILQMSMILNDKSFTKMTPEEWNAAIRPKVQGTWNLHNASISADLDLDFLVLFSSLSGIIGQPGQANYASANTFLDSFVQYRANLGLPASTIDIGAVGDVGFISQNRELLQKMTSTGFMALKEQEVLDGLLVAMTKKTTKKNEPKSRSSWFVDYNNFVLGLASTVPLDSPANRSVWRRDRRMAIYHNKGGSAVDTTTSNSSLKTYLASAKADISILKTEEAVKFFASEIGKRLFTFLLKPEEDLNTSLSLVDLGMDSLVGVELRAWWKQAFGFDVSVLEMLGMGTLEALGRHAAEGLVTAVSLENKDVQEK